MKKETFSPEERKENPQTLKIGVDIDGIVIDIYVWMKRMVKRGIKFDIDSVENHGYNLDQWPEIQAITNGKSFVMRVFENKFIYEHARPVPGAIETLNKWHNSGHELWFPTARPQGLLQEITFRWFEEHNLDWVNDRIIFIDSFNTDRAHFKSDVCRRLGLQVMIDDHAGTLKNLDAQTIKLLIGLRYPWNEKEDIGSAVLVNNWQEIDSQVEKIIKTA